MIARLSRPNLRSAGIWLLLVLAPLIPIRALPAPLSGEVAAFCSCAQDDDDCSCTDTGDPSEQRPASGALSGVPCIAGSAGVYPCRNMRLEAFVPNPKLGATRVNDIWGWQDPQSGVEYALIGLSDGTAFVSLQDPENPRVVGTLPSHSGSSNWRDIRVYQGYALIVSEASGHGLQIFDLRKLATETSSGVTFAEDAHYSDFGSAHNLSLNEGSGFAVAVGTSTCSGGLHLIDVRDPMRPSFAGCFAQDGYTHDVQCVNYHGPDPDYQDREICFASNEDTVTIVDITDKRNATMLSRTSYRGQQYTHQGWLTPNHAFFLLDDERDETDAGHNTRTYVLNVSDLDRPTLAGFHEHAIGASDHNQFVQGEHTFQANYRGGIRILRLGDLAQGELGEVAFFDTVPRSDDAGFSGAWGVYPFFDSGLVIGSDVHGGLFVLRPDLQAVSQCADGLDNDGDGLRDHPADPECEKPGAERESACGRGAGAVLAMVPLAALRTSVRKWRSKKRRASQSREHGSAPRRLLRFSRRTRPRQVGIRCAATGRLGRGQRGSAVRGPNLLILIIAFAGVIWLVLGIAASSRLIHWILETF